MAKRRFRYDRTLDKMVEIPINDDPEAQFMVRGDLQPFWSPVDGTIVEGARAYREHNKRNSVVPFEQGSEKTAAQGRSAQDRQALRERIWQYVDTAMQRGPKRRIQD